MVFASYVDSSQIACDLRMAEAVKSGSDCVVSGALAESCDQFSPHDLATAGAIVTVGNDGQQKLSAAPCRQGGHEEAAFLTGKKKRGN